jgi:branched-chain amino acid transport system ATP-binding protein
MVRTFQDVRMFVGLTVQESILVSAEVAGGSRRVARARVSELMDLFDLAGLSRQVCEVLSYGQQRRLAIARSLATRPAVLLLDEPAAGLNDAETDALGQEILRIPELAGCGILLIEHNMGLVNTVCSWLHVLDNGTEIFQGEPRDAFANPGVRDAYIGHGFSSRIALDLEAEGPS